MMRHLTICLTVFALLVSACTTHPKAPAPPKLAVKTIAVVAATNPQDYTLLNLSALGLLIPLSQTIGYIDSNQKAARFNAQQKPRESTLAADFTACVVAALRAHGYEIQVLDNIARPAKDLDDVDLDRLPTKADAILHLRFSEVGVLSPRSSTLYLPRVSAHGRLYAKGREDDLYDEDVIYGVDSRVGKKGEILGDPGFAYPDFDTLMASQQSVEKAFHTGAAKICELMAAQVHDSVK